MAAAIRPYSLERNDSELIVRMSSEMFSEEELSHFLDYLVLQSIRYRSQLIAGEGTHAALERVQPLSETEPQRLGAVKGELNAPDHLFFD